MDFELPEPAADGEIYLTTGQAAKFARVAPCTITRWREVGHLSPVPGSPPRKPLYALAAVRRAEYDAWQAALKASGTDIQIKRRRAA